MSHNPLPITNIGDPYILKDGGRYYLYATSLPDGFYVWQSDDLINWSAPSVCYRRQPQSFGSRDFWAPEVYRFGDEYRMYYTAQWKKFEDEELRIGLAVAASPLGPFEEVSGEPLFDPGYGVLDAHVFTDGDGKCYLYYSRAGHNHFVDGAQESDIYVAPLSGDGRSLSGEGVCILRPDQEWERRDGMNQYWNEGPFVLKHEGKYHLMYSANFFAGKHYGVGCAVSDSPMGPFVKYPENPILAATAEVSGPGHNSVVEGSDGGLLCVYHAHTDPMRPSGNRQLYIDPLRFENGRIRILGPTRR